MRQKHLKGEEMKPVSTIESYTQGLQICSMRVFFFLQLLFLSCTVFSFPSERTQRVTEQSSRVR